MTDHLDLGPLVKRLENELESDFPGWLITREASGQWTASKPDWGTVHGQSAPELRDRLTQHAHEDHP